MPLEDWIFFPLYFSLDFMKGVGRLRNGLDILSFLLLIRFYEGSWASAKRIGSPVVSISGCLGFKS